LLPTYSFCIGNRCDAALVNVVLQVHGSDPTLWRSAAQWEFSVNRSAMNARALLQQALRRFPQNHHLYLALFDVEINYVRRYVTQSLITIFFLNCQGLYILI
jgi:hypothetical protein